MIMNIKRPSSAARGMSLIEVIVGAAIMASSLVAIIGLYGGLTSLSLRTTPRVQAAMLLEEGAEIVRLMRDSGWTSQIGTLTNGTPYRLIWSSNAWRATTTASAIDGLFDRTVTLAAVNRDATSYNIVSSGGALDTGTRRATITVSWPDGAATTSKSVQLYIHNSFNN